jgi:sugar/nucleoside kinase (ribokinase family)
MQRIAGAYGNSNRDEYLWTRKVTHTNGTLTIDLFDGSSQSLRVPERASKITLPTIPEEFQRNISRSRPGGGAVNSRIAAQLVGLELGETHEIRLLDANERDHLIESQTPPPTRYLNLHACPRNYVLGSRDDKWIFRSPIGPADPMGPAQFDGIEWLREAHTILINGPKDVEPVKAIIAERDRHEFDLILMLTPSLPEAFLKSILPAADIVIGAWDELQFLTGDSPVTIDGAVRTVERLRRMAPLAELHVTMGKRGVLSVAADSSEPVHVELNGCTGVAVETQEVVQSRPARLCGAGDAFAGGVLVRRAFGWSLLSDAGAFRSHVQDALAGCASALRWIGVSSALAMEAFDVRSLPCAVERVTFEVCNSPEAFR